MEGGSREPNAPTTRRRAEATVSVESSELIPFDEAAPPALIEIRLNERFSGDIQGESPVRALQIRRDDGKSTMVSLQLFRGALDGRAGTFVLQGAETVENGRIQATWIVVPGSGTGELSGLRGEGGFEGEFGEGSRATLEYWFE